MPGLHSAHVSSKMLQELGDGVTIGPIVMGLEKPVQIAQMNASVSDIINLAAIAAADAMEMQVKKVTPIRKAAQKK
jgi:malate dehydrogenase (oxaloacetate-decarboxylating)(NADP+)